MEKPKRKLRSELIEFEKRETKVHPNYNNIYFNGYNNLYPNECEAAILSSPTALKCYRVKSKFIAGREIKLNGVVVKYKDLKPINNKGHNLYDVLENTAQSVSLQNGVFIWVGYGFLNGEIRPTKYEVLSFSKCRLSKEDDLENEGKIYYGDFDLGKKVDMWFYPFSDRESVVIAQLKKDLAEKKVEKYDDETDEDFFIRALPNHRGQIAFLNFDKNLIYPLNAIHAAYFDCDTEYRMSLFNNSEIKNGFMGKTLMLFNGIDEGEETKIKDDLKSWIGEEGSSGIYAMFVKDDDELQTMVRSVKLESSFDDKVFENTRKVVSESIIGAFETPAPLVSSGDGSLFGTSGDAYFETKKIYDDLTQSYRSAIENFFYKIGLGNVEIVPLTYIEEIAEEIENIEPDTVIENEVISNLKSENWVLKNIKSLLNNLKKPKK